MTDPADRHLADRLHALARGVSVPVVPPDDDVRRGRRRLLRLRLTMVGATTATLCVVVGITSLTAGHPTATEIPPTTQLTTLPATPDSSPTEETGDDAGASGHRQGSGGSKAGAGSVGDTHTTAGDTESTPTRLPVADQPTGDTVTKGDPSPGYDDPTHGPTASDPTTAPTDSTPTQTPSETPTSQPTAPPTSTPTTPPTPPTETSKISVPRVLRYYNDVLAEHLDPTRDHLQPYDRTVDAKHTTRGGGQLFALGSTYRWADGHALAGLQISVASGWDMVDWECGASYSDWACHSVPVDGGSSAEVADHDGVHEVAVEHPGRQVVVLTADPYSAGTERATGVVGASEADLVAAAADVRLKLPGVAPAAPPTLDGATFAAAGQAALVRKDEAFTQTSIDRTPEVRGGWSVAGTRRGTLDWSALPIYSGGGWRCLTTYRTCSEVVVDDIGTTVHVAALKAKAGGGWLVQYDGPSYAVRVLASDRKFAKKRAYAFVTQPAWQPVR